MSPHAPRIAVVGAGWWATAHHLPALAELAARGSAEIVAVVDADPGRARKAATEFAVPLGTDDLEAVTAVGLDGAVVATPHSTHHAIAGDLIDAGIGVLIEKPLATTAADAFDLVRRHEATGGVLAVGYTAEYSRAARIAREWVADEIGELVQVSIDFASAAGARYATTDAADERSAYSARTGGGQASTQLTHAVASAMYATGRQAETVAALTSDRRLAVDVDDAAVFRLAGAVMGAAVSTGALEPGAPMRHRVRFLGTRGTVSHDLLHATARLETAVGSLTVGPRHDEPAYPAREPVRAFVHLLSGAVENPAPIRPAAATVAFIETLLHAAESGGFRDVPQLPPLED
ncbi:Gfo/Idh/MocA family oxidoreductase [Agromyces sp. H66]|uniref:Gfo/Idh/MocA family protein n=1 Tax=Agromyces sp. H66 TaxID=2529859 RepID=UPI00145AD35A|nr:Gfo/Idh/MocA family oxidoreductase [Agromyces sp. H66]